jgi:hypothetical protein
LNDQLEHTGFVNHNGFGNGLDRVILEVWLQRC